MFLCISLALSIIKMEEHRGTWNIPVLLLRIYQLSMIFQSVSILIRHV